MKHLLPPLLAILLAAPLAAADPQPPRPAAATATDDASKPWEAWRNGSLAYEDGETARESGDFVRALSNYRKAVRAFRSVREARPEWNRRVIDERIALCEKAIADMRRLLGRAPDESDPEPAPAAPAPAPVVEPAPAAVAPVSPDLLKSEAEEYKRRFFAAQAELDQLKRGDARAKASLEELGNLMREYRVLEEKNRLLEARIAQLEQPPAEAADSETGRRLVELRINLENTLRKLKLATGEAAEYKQENDRLRDLNDDLAKEAARIRGESARFRQEAEQLRPIREEAERERNRALLREEEWKKQLEELRRTVEARDRELAELGDRLRSAAGGTPLDLNDENLKLRDELRSLREAREAEAAETLRLRNETREQKLEIAERGNAIQSLNDRVTALDRENRVMREQLDKRSGAAAIADRELVTLRAANRELEEQLANAADREKGFETRLAAAVRADRAAADSLREERDGLRRQLEAARLEATSQTAALDEAKQQRAEAEKRYAELREEFLKLKAASLSAAEAEKKVPRLEAEKQSLAAEVEPLRQRLAALELALNEEKQRTAEVAQLRENLAALKRALDEEKQRAAEAGPLRKKLAAAEKNAAAVPSLREQVTKLEAENRQLRDRPAAETAPKTPVPATATAAKAPDADAVRKFRADAAKAEAEGADELAIWNYRQILRAAPDDPDANYGLGRLLLARGENKAAQAALRIAHLAEPANLARRTAYAAALTRGGDPGSAVALLTAAGELPEDFAASLELGRALRLAGRADEAEAPLRRAARLRPQEPGPQLELARLFAADRPKEAARCYENAKKYGATPDPELERSLGPLVNQRAELADFLAGAAAEAEKNGDDAAAGWYFAELVKADPENPAHRWKAIQYLLLQNRLEEAGQMLGDADGPADRVLRAAWLILQGKTAEAATALEGTPGKVPMPLLPALARRLGDSPAAEAIRARATP